MAYESQVFFIVVGFKNHFNYIPHWVVYDMNCETQKYVLKRLRDGCFVKFILNNRIEQKCIFRQQKVQ